MNERKPFTEYMQMYDFGYLLEILHRNMYEYALMDGYEENIDVYNAIWDFLYDNLQWKGAETK